MSRKYLLAAGWLLVLLLFTVAGAGETKLSIEGNRFLVNGEPFDMWGIRVSSAGQSDKYTDHLIEQLDDYREHGANAVTVFFQGSSGGYSDPFSPDGTRIDPNHLGRMKRIIEACDEREMVVVVGVIYQRTIQHKRKLADAAAVRNAVRTVARELAACDNIIINIANEQNSNRYRGWSGYDFRDPENIIELCRVVREQDPDRLVGGGGYDDEKSLTIGLSPHVDVLLFDTTGPDRDNSSGWHHDYFVENGVRDKPIVNVELYGGWTGQFKDPPGHFPDDVKAIYYRDAKDAATRKGLSVFFHSNVWCQGPSDGFPLRYDLAGQGTKTDPGIHWYFDYVESLRTDAL